MEDKADLFSRGLERIRDFCTLNDVDIPEVITHLSQNWSFSACAYYRNRKIHICLAKCAIIGTGGASWSYPGYVIDRTPYGVLAHELGHYFDVINGSQLEENWIIERRYTSEFGVKLRSQSGEPKLTNYCPNDGEWFAEMFRLFVTNPDLLARVRPATYQLLLEHFSPLGDPITPWKEVLSGAPDRTIFQAEKKIKQVEDQ